AGFVFCLRADLPYRPPQGASFGSYAQHLRGSLVSLRALMLFSLRFLTAFVIFGVYYVFYPQHVCIRLGADAAAVGPGFSFYAAGMFAGASAVPALTRMMPQWAVGLLGGVLFIAFDAALFLGTSLWSAFLASLFIGLSSGIISANTVSHVSMITTPDTRGSVLAAYSFIFRLCQSCAPTVCGLLFAAGSYEAVYTAGGAVCTAITLIAVLAFSAADRAERRRGV
ncbi:MAG: hypothetical protein MJ061_05465, partial [Mailhella sp.]|nr:hypothetical protein [Mailhella sp.]